MKFWNPLMSNHKQSRRELEMGQVRIYKIYNKVEAVHSNT